MIGFCHFWLLLFRCCPGRAAIAQLFAILTGITPRWCNPRSREFAAKYGVFRGLSTNFAVVIAAFASTLESPHEAC